MTVIDNYYQLTTLICSCGHSKRNIQVREEGPTKVVDGITYSTEAWFICRTCGKWPDHAMHECWGCEAEFLKDWHSIIGWCSEHPMCLNCVSKTKICWCKK